MLEVVFSNLHGLNAERLMQLVTAARVLQPYLHRDALVAIQTTAQVRLQGGLLRRQAQPQAVTLTLPTDATPKQEAALVATLQQELSQGLVEPTTVTVTQVPSEGLS
jgi:hypothetical protein